jgi:hypothetical protein
VRHKLCSLRLEANSVPCQLAPIEFFSFICPTGGGNTRSSLDSRDGCGLPTCVHFTPNTHTCLLLVLVTVLLQAQHRSDYLGQTTVGWSYNFQIFFRASPVGRTGVLPQKIPRSHAPTPPPFFSLPVLVPLTVLFIAPRGPEGALLTFARRRTKTR